MWSLCGKSKYNFDQWSAYIVLCHQQWQHPACKEETAQEMMWQENCGLTNPLWSFQHPLLTSAARTMLRGSHSAWYFEVFSLFCKIKAMKKHLHLCFTNSNKGANIIYNFKREQAADHLSATESSIYYNVTLTAVNFKTFKNCNKQKEQMSWQHPHRSTLSFKVNLHCVFYHPLLSLPQPLWLDCKIETALFPPLHTPFPTFFCSHVANTSAQSSPFALGRSICKDLTRVTSVITHTVSTLGQICTFGDCILLCVIQIAVALVVRIGTRIGDVKLPSAISVPKLNWLRLHAEE